MSFNKKTELKHGILDLFLLMKVSILEIISKKTERKISY